MKKPSGEISGRLKLTEGETKTWARSGGLRNTPLGSLGDEEPTPGLCEGTRVIAGEDAQELPGVSELSY